MSCRYFSRFSFHLPIFDKNRSVFRKNRPEVATPISEKMSVLLVFPVFTVHTLSPVRFGWIFSIFTDIYWIFQKPTGSVTSDFVVPPNFRTLLTSQHTMEEPAAALDLFHPPPASPALLKEPASLIMADPAVAQVVEAPLATVMWLSSDPQPCSVLFCSQLSVLNVSTRCRWKTFSILSPKCLQWKTFSILSPKCLLLSCVNAEKTLCCECYLRFSYEWL
jgi:hypothetical protein